VRFLRWAFERCVDQVLWPLLRLLMSTGSQRGPVRRDSCRFLNGELLGPPNATFQQVGPPKLAEHVDLLHCFQGIGR
jgi:hypothetical protein